MHCLYRNQICRDAQLYPNVAWTLLVITGTLATRVSGECISAIHMLLLSAGIIPCWLSIQQSIAIVTVMIISCVSVKHTIGALCLLHANDDGGWLHMQTQVAGRKPPALTCTTSELKGALLWKCVWPQTGWVSDSLVEKCDRREGVFLFAFSSGLQITSQGLISSFSRSD